MCTGHVLAKLAQMNRPTTDLHYASPGGIRESVPQYASASPFLLENETAYRRWRKCKLAAFMEGLSGATKRVPIAEPQALSDAERDALITQCRQLGFAFYRISGHGDKQTFKRLGAQLGLHTLLANNPCVDKERISNIQAIPDSRYIPYTARALKWHTDGYYASGEDTVGAFAMHCIRPSKQGGENQYFDPEILYILLRDENPDYVAMLMHPQALCVPQNADELNLVGTHNARVGPVFALHPRSGELITRYTERRHYIIWRRDGTTKAARTFIKEALHTPSNYCITSRLDVGEGVVCNNVLHNRSSFYTRCGNYQRLLYRARYYERVADTGYATLLDR